MNLIDRITAALDNSRVRIDSNVFEECATDLLQGRYPNLVPVRGGSDSGRDADLLEQTGVPPVRMAITSSRTYEGARKNLRGAMRSLTEHGMSGKNIVSVNLAELNQSKRKKLEDFALDNGYTLESIIDRAFFADRLRQNGEWREKLLGLPGGPFSLSRYSIRGDIKPRNFDLIGREEELESIRSSSDDLLLYGVPGVGKSALLENIPGLYFVDGDPSIERLMDDILATQPHILVVDDTLRRTAILENLQLIRRQENLTFRIIAVGWPHQREELKVHVPAAAEIRIMPLIRQDIGAIVRNAGIGLESLITRILDQAQGRPAWAVRLADLLKNDVEWRQVHTGEAIRGEVSQYLTRSGLSREAKDVLAVIAILGSLAESEISILSEQSGIPRLTFVHLINDLAVGGLLDVQQQWTRHGSQENVYGVAPQILATSIVVEAFFGSGTAMLPVIELFESWHTKQESITVHCISAALLNEQGAHTLARSFFTELVERDALGVNSDIYRYYVHLGADEARDILQRSIAEWVRLEPDETEYLRKAMLERIAVFVADAIRDMDYIAIVDDALSFAATIDRAPLAQEFLSKVVNGVRNSSIPDGSLNLRPLFCIWEAAARWFADSLLVQRAHILAMLVCELLNPALEASSLSPEDSRLLRLISVVLPPESMEKFKDEIWTPFTSLATELGHDELALLANLFRTWMQIARGFNPGFGGELSTAQISAAKTVAAHMADYIIVHCDEFPGIRATIRRYSEVIDRGFPEGDPLAAAVFFVSDEELDWRDRMRRYQEVLGRQVRLGMEQPLEFMGRLAYLRPHMSDWDQPLTNPLHTIFRLIATEDVDLLPLLLFAKANGLFPEAGPLVAAALDQSDIEETALLGLLDDEGTRSYVVQYALTTVSADRYFNQIVGQLMPGDVVDMVFPPSIADQLLRHPDPEVRASAAATILVHTDGELGAGLPAETVALVRDALGYLTMPIAIRGHGAKYLFERLIACAPDVYEQLLAKAIAMPPGGKVYTALRPFEHTASMLTADVKTRLLVMCEPGTSDRHHVLEVLRGNDMDWLESLLESGLADPDEVASTFNGLRAPVPIEALARLLIPRGVDPLVIATKVELGVQWGEKHDRLEGYVERMRDLAQSAEPAIAAVGQAGFEHYAPLVQAERLRFRENQVRGR